MWYIWWRGRGIKDITLAESKTLQTQPPTVASHTVWAQEWFRQVTEFCWIWKQKVPFVCFMSNKVKSQWWKLLLVPLKVWELFLLLQSCRALDFTLKHPMLRQIWSNRRFSRNRRLTLFRSSSNLALVSSSNALMSAMVIPCHLSVQQNSCSYIIIALIDWVKLCFLGETLLFHLSVEVGEYPLLSPLNEALNLVLQPPPKTARWK